MVSPNWSLLQMNGPQGGFQNALAQGWQMGTAVRQQREQQEQRNALTDYITNPNDQTFAGLAQVLPETAMPIMQQRQQAQQQAQEQDMRRRAAEGDPEAMAQLAGIDLNAWRGLNSDQQAAAAERVDAIGQAALQIAQLPPAQRAAAWDQSVAALSQRWPELAQYRGQYSDEALNSAIQQSGQVQQLWNMTRPSYQVIPQGGTMVNTRDPNAVASVAGGSPPAQTPAQGQPTEVDYQGFQRMMQSMTPQQLQNWRQRNPNVVVRVNSPQEAQSLPSGTAFIAPGETQPRTVN